MLQLSLLYWGLTQKQLGTAVRFEPGETKRVRLVAVGGTRMGYGLNGLVEGSMDSPAVRETALKNAQEKGFKGVVSDGQD